MFRGTRPGRGTAYTIQERSPFIAVLVDGDNTLVSQKVLHP